MKLELIKETKLGDKPWYEIRMNDRLVTGSYDLERMEEVYANVKNGGDPFLTKEILRSEEIVVPSEETN
jgi:hypothetical protein